MDSAYVSITGPKGSNQDSLLAPATMNGITIAGVADGVGGHADGKFASETAIDAIAKFVENDPNAGLQNAFIFARQAIVQAAARFPLSASMATTLSVVRISEDKAEVGHVGDSRVYHLRDDGLLSRTVDQTEIAELVRQNVFTPEEALRYPRRNVLLSSLAVNSMFDFYQTVFQTSSGDAIVICTDGLYNSVRKSEFIRHFRETETAQEFVDAVVEEGSDRGFRDDATIIVVRL
jgi:PPM family protein phosphatase